MRKKSIRIVNGIVYTYIGESGKRLKKKKKRTLGCSAIKSTRKRDARNCENTNVFKARDLSFLRVYRFNSKKIEFFFYKRQLFRTFFFSIKPFFYLLKKKIYVHYY